MFLVTGFSILLSHITLMLCTEVTHDIPTYNCPCVNTAFRTSNPTYVTDWPWDLLIDIAKHTFTGNCCQENSNGTWVSHGVIFSLGMNVILPACSPVSSHTSSTWLLILVTIILVPLQTPSPGLEFLRIITGLTTHTHNRFCRNLYLKCLIRFKDILQVYKYFKCLYSINFKCK